MDGTEICVVIFFGIFALIVGLIIAIRRWDSLPTEETDSIELLSGLPAIYYSLSVFCGIVLLGFTAVNSGELNSTQIGAWIGYTVGAVLSILAIGRVIELLQQIRDAVRS